MTPDKLKEEAIRSLEKDVAVAQLDAMKSLVQEEIDETERHNNAIKGLEKNREDVATCTDVRRLEQIAGKGQRGAAY